MDMDIIHVHGGPPLLKPGEMETRARGYVGFQFSFSFSLDTSMGMGMGIWVWVFASRLDVLIFSYIDNTFFVIVSVLLLLL